MEALVSILVALVVGLGAGGSAEFKIERVDCHAPWEASERRSCARFEKLRSGR